MNQEKIILMIQARSFYEHVENRKNKETKQYKKKKPL